MDRLIAEAKTGEKISKIEEKTENLPKNAEKTQKNEQKTEEIVEKAPPVNNSYLNTFENMTVADIKREEEKKKEEEFKKEKEILIQQQYETKVETIEEEPKQEFVQNIIEKPNYDLLEENNKVVKLKTKTKTKNVKSKKRIGVVLACALGALTIVSVVNSVLIEKFQTEYIQIDETYNFRLAEYLKNLNNLDQTKNGMEMIETYPDEQNPAGDVGKKSNWFDRICEFIARLFGG